MLTARPPASTRIVSALKTGVLRSSRSAYFTSVQYDMAFSSTHLAQHGRPHLVGGDTAVEQGDLARAARCCFRIVGHHAPRGAVAMQRFQQLDHGVGVLGVEV